MAAARSYGKINQYYLKNLCEYLCMDKLELIELIYFLLVITLPLTYFLTTTYMPYHYSGERYNADSSEVKQYVTEHEPVTVREIEEDTSLSYMQSFYIAQELTFQEEILKCNSGLRTSCAPKVLESPQI